MKKVLIIAHFCSDFDGNGNNRFNYLANLLKNDCNLEFITTDFSHRKKDYRKLADNKTEFNITMLHELKYKNNISLRRLCAHKVFGKNLKKYLENLNKKPDVIYCAIPSLDAAIEAGLYAKKNGIKFIIDIQDLWPEAFSLAINIPAFFYPMEKKADKVYKLADEIVAVSNEYCNRAYRVNKKVKSVHPVYIGTNLNQFDQNVVNHSINRIDDNIIIAYCGSLSASYDLQCAIDAIAILNSQGYKHIKFLVMGNGPFKEKFMMYANNKGINAQFTGRLPYSEMCGMLSSCDIAANLIVRGAAQSIINKHADYAAAGIPVINSQECCEYRDLVDKYEMGLNCNASDPADMAKKLKVLIDNPIIRISMGKNARKCAEEHFDRQKTYIELKNLICK